MNTRSILIASGVGVLILSSLSFAAVRGGMGMGRMGGDETVRTAVESNNYSALSDTAKSKITQDQFTNMVQKRTQNEAVRKAIEAGDYTAFKNAMIAQIPTEAEFQEMVTQHKAHTAAQSAIETAVKNNDFAAFKTAMEAQKPINSDDDNAPKALSDMQLQKHFNMLVAYYKANGELPEMGMGFGPAGKGMGMGGGRGEMGPRR